MSTAGSAIQGAQHGHSAPILDLRADLHPNEPHGGPLRPLRTAGVPWDTPWIRPPWRAAAAALTAGHSRTGSSSPSATRVSTAWRTASLASTRLTCRLRQEDCSLCDGVTNLKGYLSTKTGQLQLERHSSSPIVSNPRTSAAPSSIM